MSLLTGVDPAASWILALAILLVVTGVVWFLLHRVAGAAIGIRTEVAAVWEHGQRVANNTIHVVKLNEIASGVEAILASAGGIAVSAEAIRSHAETCPGCPSCFLARA